MAEKAFQFKTPEEELQYLRKQVKEKERELEGVREKEAFLPQEETIRREVAEYGKRPQEEVLASEFSLPKEKIEDLSLNLVPEAHDRQVEELIGIMEDKGVHNTLSILEKLKNPHLEDDFHRVLVQMVKGEFPVRGIKQKGTLWNVLHMTLFEISLPEADQAALQKPLKELLSSMEQLYLGMLSGGETGAEHFTLEIALADKTDEIIIYAAVPDRKKDLFEKQVLSIFPQAVLVEQANDYNVFVDGGVSLGARGYLSEHDILPLKTYDFFDSDPLNVLLNAFSKIETEGGGAAVQFVFSSEENTSASYYREIIKKVERGVSFNEAIKTPRTFAGALAKGTLEEAAGLFFGKSKKEKEKEDVSLKKPIDAALLELLHKKIETRIVSSNVRIISSARTEARAEEILLHLTSSFNQFENARGNRFSFSRLSGGALFEFFRMFSFREFVKKFAIPLNIREAVSVMHFPVKGMSAPQVKQSRAGRAPAPVGLPQEGTLLGMNRVRGMETKIYLTKEDRLRHLYSVGQTGTGKTTFLKNMIAQDIKEGSGVCMIDPHGSDLQDVLALVPEERFEDVIYFDPSYMERVFALNMLEYDERFPEQKTFVVNELFSIFQKLYAGTPEAMGPIFEQYFRNATQLVMEDPETGNTLLDVSRVLADSRYRAVKLAACKNPVIKQFWQDIALKAGGDSSLQNIVPYITSKFDVFAANDYMRPLIAQQRSSFNFRSIMDERKILLINLAKGRLGDINAHLIGLILVGKILMAALSRVDAFQSRSAMPPFYLYIDEFQNVTTDSIAVILSEARKYKLSLTVAHQFIAQLNERIRDAVFGNVGSLAVFRVGSGDAEYLEKQFTPVFTAKDLMNIENRNAYVRLLSHGIPQKPFSMEVSPPPQGESTRTEILKKMSYEKYGRPRAEVEEMIAKRYRPIP